MENLPPWTIPLIIALALFGAGAVIFRKLRETKSNSVDGRLATFAERSRNQTESAERGMSALASRVDSMVNRGQKGSDLARDLAQADLKLTVTEFIMMKFGSVILFALFGVFLGRANFLAVVACGVVGAIIGFIVPDKVVSFKQGSRLKAFNNQLGDTVGLLANSLRSGYSLLQSMDLVSREAPPPISVEFRRVVQEVGLGLSLEDGMNNLLRRVPSDDLDLMVSAINIQAEVGGNLAEILDTIAHTIRERVRIKGQIRVLTSQARYSGYVVTLLPIAIAIIITMLNPEYMAPLMSFGLPPENWCCMPVCSAMMMIAGFFAIKSIVNIEV
ncbi:MAG: type II secretion system F family protein [Chloroflexi bacterium]|nr:type II secretion system F family protein [Chloroflexota bacterium]